MDNTIVVDESFKNLIRYAIRCVIKYNMLDAKMGSYNEVLKSHVFTEDEYKQIDAMIESEMFPSGYYDLCDLIGDEYV